MAYPKKGKTTPLTPKERPKLSEQTDAFREGLFNHDECKKMFEERLDSATLTVSKESMLLCSTFKKLMPELSDSQLNLSDIDGEYEQLMDLMNKNYKAGQTYPTKKGIFLLMVTLIRKHAAKLYCETEAQRLQIFKACQDTMKQFNDLAIPIRDKCMEEFYAKATSDQLADIRAVVKHRENPSANGMPGNGGIPQFRG